MIVSVGDLPSGTLTFLFTDLEGSTALWESQPDVMREAVARHDQLLSDAVTANGGQVVKSTGDGMVAVFVNATDGVAAALVCQQTLGAEDWPVPIKARMGLYTGEAEAVDGDYHAPALNRAARVMDAGHGGQVLLASSTAGLTGGMLPARAELVDLGEHRLRDLGRPEVLLQLVHPDLARSFPPLRTLEAFPGNLPLQVSSFIGREKQLDWCRRALDEHRVLTLTGVGGVGKTRLALQLAAQVVQGFRDGTWLVELAPVRDRHGVAEAVLAALGVPPGSEDAETQLVDALASKEALLVLDNCEHVLGGVSELVERIVQSCPDVKVLATSREGMAIMGEQLMAVPPLDVGRSDADLSAVLASDAVELFVERAQTVNAEFRVGPDNAEAVAEICRRLDGVPLAIELAAARVIALGPQDLARRLDRRFQMLAGARRGAIERHATLRAAIDWSFDLLSESEKTLLARLSVFAGTFDLDAAEVICVGDPVEEFDVLDLLSALVAQSLVVADQSGLGTRYKLLETIRQYGEEQLAEDEIAVLRDRHTSYFAQLLQDTYGVLWGPEEIRALKQRAAEADNIHAAHAQAVDSGNIDLATRLVVFYDWTMIGEQRLPPAAPVLAMDGVSSHRLFPVLLLSAAFEAVTRGDHATSRRCIDEAHSYYQSGLDEEADRLFVAMDAWLPTRGFLYAGRYEEAAEACLHSAEVFERLDVEAGHAWGLAGATYMRELGGLDPGPSLAYAEEAVQLARRSGSPRSTAWALLSLAGAAAHDSPDRARNLLVDGLQTVAATGQEMFSEMAAASQLALRLHEWQLAIALAARVLWLTRWQPDPALVGGQLACLARSTVDTQPETGATLVGAAYSCFRRAAPKDSETVVTATPESHNPLLMALRESHEIAIASLGKDQALRCRDHGASMDLDESVRYALTQAHPPTVSEALHHLVAGTEFTGAAAGSDDEADLTARQLEVARLVARGLSNKDIAKRLDVSPYTVETHVRNILERLDATNRAQIVAWVKDNDEPPADTRV